MPSATTTDFRRTSPPSSAAFYWKCEKDRQKLTMLDVFNEEPRGWTQVASNTSLMTT
jgi:hypothetical protein